MTQYEKDLAAMEQYGHALEYVKDQTPEICLAAVKENGLALKYVKDQTPEICMAAVTQNGYALEYVQDQTPEICLIALKGNINSANFLKAPLDDEVLRYLVENNIKFDKRLIKKNIPEDLKLLLVLNYGISTSKFK